MPKKFPFPVALAATAIAIPLAQKATATEIQNPLDYVKLATPVGAGERTTWRSPAFHLAIPPGGSGKMQKVLSLPAQQSIGKSDLQTTEGVETRSKDEKIYRVKLGDTLSAIAQRELVPLKDLIDVNKLKSPDALAVGQEIIVPSNEKRILPQNLRQAVSSISPFAEEKISVVAMATLGNGKGRAYPTVNQQTTNRWLQKYGSRGAIANNESENVALDKNREKPKLSKKRSSALRKNFSGSNRSQLVGASAGAMVNTGQYNDMMRVRSRESVAPELPPLSTPDNYLPNYPTEFSGYIYPAKGVLTSGYGWRWGKMHKGIDIAAPIGTPVVAAAAGRVVWAGWNRGGYGNMVKVLHADGSVTLYAHNSRVLVYPGQMVRQGEQIAQMGSTGYSTGSHLHFEIHRGIEVVNPMAYLPR